MRIVQPALFAAAPALPGLMQADDFLTPEEERDLIAAIGGVSLAPFNFHGYLGKRLTASFGWRYDFETARLGGAAPIPGWLLPMRERAARFAGLAPEALAQALLTRYDPGAGIGWHRDRPEFGEVLGISLGAPARMRFRRRIGDGFARAFAELAPRSIYHLDGEARQRWEHSIGEMVATRWSITFRSLSEKARRAAPQ
jgi:DNA oxidative demethylase